MIRNGHFLTYFFVSPSSPGEFNWAKYLGYVKSGAKTVYKHVAPIVKEVVLNI